MSGRLGYTDIRNADLGPLSEAVTKWNTAPGKFLQVGVNFGTDVTNGLATSDWEGEAADAAARKFRVVQEQIRAAAEEARSVHSVLSQGLEEFRAAKKALEEIETDLQGHRHLRLNKSDGSVYIDLSTAGDDDVAALTKAYQETLAYFRERTNSAIERAEQADAALAQALTADVNGADRGFNGKAYDTLEQARAEAAKDLRTALDLAGLEQGRMTSAQLERLALVMARHSRDPEFAEQFAAGLGPEKTLRLWYNATHPRNALHPDTDIDEKSWWKSARSLQESLGTTLATASHSQSPEMRAWKDEVLRLGPERLNTGGATQPFGFQIMSNLMRSGTYEAGFLNRYGDKLLAWDEQHNTKKGFPYWSNTGAVDPLNLIGRREDNGQDAVTGFLEALGHHPKAATSFFAPPAGEPAGTNPHLEYLVKERNWVFDGHPTAPPRDLPGHEALGHALTAATTGYAWDAEEFNAKDPEIFGVGGERRTGATADVMEQVVRIYGGEDGPMLLHHQPGMVTALGVMGGSYVDDINYAVSGLGDPEGNKDSQIFSPAYSGRADFGRDGAIAFLSVLGHNRESHAIMNQAEHLYTLGQFAQFPPREGAENVKAAAEALEIEAEVRGLLDRSRVAKIEETYAYESQQAKSEFQNSSNWTRVGYSGAAPAITAGILSVAGKSGPWGLVIPIASGAFTEFGKLFHSDAVVAPSDLPPPEDSRQFYARGEQQLGATLDAHFDGRDSGHSDRVEEIKEAYIRGRQDSADRGLKPYPAVGP
ncbi:hypothetical protein AB0N23_11935 [Streptomyces sp. NPDC052644]